MPSRIPVKILPAFWITAILLGWVSSQSFLGILIWVVVILFSVLVHEFGHALTASFFGQSVRIELVAFGGVTIREEKTLSNSKEFIVVLMGPFAGFLLYLLCNFLRVYTINESLLDVYLTLGAHANFFWTICNILPIYPLDGGHLIRILFKGLFGPKGEKFSFLLSMLIGFILSLLFFLLNQMLFGSILFIFTIDAWNHWKNFIITDQDLDKQIQGEIEQALHHINLGKESEAIHILKGICSRLNKGTMFLSAIQILSKLYFKRHCYEEVFNMLYPQKNVLSLEFLELLQLCGYCTQHYKESREIGEKAFQEAPKAHTALFNALCSARLKQVEPALGWLNSAILEGLVNVEEVLEKEDFDAIRNEKDFIHFLHSKGSF